MAETEAAKEERVDCGHGFYFYKELNPERPDDFDGFWGLDCPECPPYLRRVKEDKGLTPGNDRCLLLECGHERYVDVPYYTDGKREVGDLEVCLECADIAELRPT